MFSNFSSFRDHITLKDVLFSGIPTAGTYSGYLQGYLNNMLPPWLLERSAIILLFSILVFLIILFILYLVNVEAHKKSLAELLASGYYLNFSGKLALFLKQKSDLIFLFADDKLIVPSDKVKVEITLPTSMKALKKVSSKIDEKTRIAYIDSEPFNHPFWVRISSNKKRHATIHEVPRTLFALPKHLGKDYKPKDSRKLHKAFNSKFRELMEENSGDIPLNRFQIKED